LEFSLSKAFFRKLVKSPCHYCGQQNTQRTSSHRRNGSFYHIGVDRKDNTKGYTIKNSLPCCKICNRAKSAMTYRQFKNWIKKLRMHKVI
jgi:hypothetical protein